MAWTKSSKSGLSTDVSANNTSLGNAETAVTAAKNAVSKYVGDNVLKGDGYDSSKAYFEICHGIVLDSLSLLLGDGKTANQHVTSTFDGTVVEPLGHEAEKSELEKSIKDLQTQNSELRQEISDAERDADSLSDKVDVFFLKLSNNALIRDNDDTIKKLRDAIQQVDAYSSAGDDKFGDVETLISHIDATIKQMDGSFDAGTGIFTISNNFASGLIAYIKKSYVNEDGTVNEEKMRTIYDKGDNASYLDLAILNQFLPKPLPLTDLSLDKFSQELKTQVGDADYHSLNMEQKSLFVFDVEYHDDTYKAELDRIFGPASDGSTILETDDQNMRFFIYTAADNDYGKLFLQNLDKIKVATWNEQDGQFYKSFTGKVYINIEANRDSGKGNYVTFFHEVGHLFDDKLKGWGSLKDYKNAEGHNLDDTIKADARLAIMAEMDKVIGDQKISDEDKEKILSHILDPHYDEWDTNKVKIYSRIPIDDPTLEGIRDQVSKNIRDQITGGNSEAVSDVYGGLSGNELRGSWGHGQDYWYSGGLFPSRKSPAGEFFAEHFSYQMTGDQLNGYTRTANGFVPSSTQGMDPNLDSHLEQNGKWLSSSSALMDEIIHNQVN